MLVPIFTTCKYRLVPNTVIVISPYLLPEVESRTQDSGPRTQKKSEAKAKNSLSEDRHSRGQGQEWGQGHKRKCSPKKKGLHKNFSGDLKKKKVFKKNFQAISKKTFSKKFF